MEIPILLNFLGLLECLFSSLSFSSCQSSKQKEDHLFMVTVTVVFQSIVLIEEHFSFKRNCLDLQR